MVASCIIYKIGPFRTYCFYLLIYLAELPTGEEGEKRGGEQAFSLEKMYSVTLAPWWYSEQVLITGR